MRKPRTERERMFASAVTDAASTFNSDMERLHLQAETGPKYGAKVKNPLPFQHCYLCGTQDNVEDISYGDFTSGCLNSLVVCPECRKSFGEFLLSGKKSFQLNKEERKNEQ